MNLFPRNEIEELKDNSTDIIYQITDWFIPENDKNNKKDDEEIHHLFCYFYHFQE